jgi:hypothetical protein
MEYSYIRVIHTPLYVDAVWACSHEHGPLDPVYNTSTDLPGHIKDAQRSNAELVTVAAIQKATRLDGWRQMMPTADDADLE